MTISNQLQIFKTPDLKYSIKNKWQAWWPLHVYLFGASFLLLLLMSIDSLLGLIFATAKRMQGRTTFILIHSMVCYFTAATCLPLLVDPYQSGYHFGSANYGGFEFVLFEMRTTCIVGVFSLIQLSLVDAIKVQVFPSAIQRLLPIAMIILFHAIIVLSLDVVAIVATIPYMSEAYQAVTFLLCCALCLSAVKIHSSIEQFLVSRTTNEHTTTTVVNKYSDHGPTSDSSLDNQPYDDNLLARKSRGWLGCTDRVSTAGSVVRRVEVTPAIRRNTVSPLPTNVDHSDTGTLATTSIQLTASIFSDRNIRKLANLNLTLGYFGSLYCLAALYGLFISAADLNTDPWIWYALQTMYRVTELGMVTVAVYTVRSPFILARIGYWRGT